MRDKWLNEAAQRFRGVCIALQDGASFDDYSYRTLTTLYYVTSYIYYVKDSEVIPDMLYEELCLALLRRFGEQDSAVYNKVSIGALEAGSGYDLQYPMSIVNISEALLLGGVR